MGDSGARTLQARVLEHIRVQGLWTPSETVAVGVSGGVDSMVLLHLLHRTQRAHGGDLVVMSINHGLREASVQEVAMVEAQCLSLGLCFETCTLELKPGANLAERARDARRSALQSLGTDKIATAHHQDDQAETVLYHLLRGSGMQGLKGMTAQAGRWVRPLLREPKSVLKAWAELEDVQWMEDPSNPESQRGAIRRILPQLDELHGGAGRALARSARLLAREDALLSELTAQAWARVSRDEGLDRGLLAAEPEALQLRLLRKLISDPGVRAEQLEAVVAGALIRPGRLDLGGGLSLICVDGCLRLARS
jgi:tRNA(Ile)-lysidine synthase